MIKIKVFFFLLLGALAPTTYGMPVNTPTPTVLLILAQPVHEFDWYEVIEAASRDWKDAVGSDFMREMNASTILILERESDWCIVFFGRGGGRLTEDPEPGFYHRDDDIVWVHNPNRAVYLDKSTLEVISPPADSVSVPPALSTFLPPGSSFFKHKDQ